MSCRKFEEIPEESSRHTVALRDSNVPLFKDKSLAGHSIDLSSILHVAGSYSNEQA